MKYIYSELNIALIFFTLAVTYTEVSGFHLSCLLHQYQLPSFGYRRNKFDSNTYGIPSRSNKELLVLRESENCERYEENSDNDDIDNKRSEMEGGQPVLLEDLDWRLARMKLEEQRMQRILKSKPRFLPYEDCRKWVQAWGGRWKTEQDWKDWINDGEKRNAYIPARPDEYYTRIGKWISWEHFLIGDEEDES